MYGDRVGQANLLWVVHDVRKAASYCILDNGVHIFRRKLRRVVLKIHRLRPCTAPSDEAPPLARIFSPALPLSRHLCRKNVAFQKRGITEESPSNTTGKRPGFREISWKQLFAKTTGAADED